MALIDELEKVNAVLTFLERAENLEGRKIISVTMAAKMRDMSITYLETIFPPPPES